MAERHGGQFDLSSYLPPRDYWLFDPEKDDPLPTPVDEHGLVNVEELITLVKSQFDPSYPWKSPLKDEHHLYFEHADYPDIEIDGVNLAEFRSLRINRIIVQRDFHEAIHLRTIKPSIPSADSIYNQIRRARLMARMFHSARGSIWLTRARYMSDERLRRGEEFHLNDYYAVREAVHDTLPQDFQPRELDYLLPKNIEELRKIVPALGRLATTGKYARRITQPLAA